MKCPNCKEPNLILSERADIEIDYCPDCRGIWLDRGELDKILERTRVRDTTAPQEDPYQAGRPSGNSQQGYKKKKSFLEELFD